MSLIDQHFGDVFQARLFRYGAENRVGLWSNQNCDVRFGSKAVLRRLGPDIQWVESYVADNKTFCVYLAKDEAIIREHAAISGFPATKITAVKKMIDPTTEAA